ncbi:hypothetical protein ACFSTH_13495 [Paenibacillus yanchengensis]|uniref:Uncharacterized protein n=1 Tax=Paenibacillus yanchengensis TaxID=2035833 RepID=A0ABW4YFI8_9BACL
MSELQTDLHYITNQTPSPRRTKRNKRLLVVFLILWLILIGSGIWLAKWYIDTTKEQMTIAIEQQTKAEVTALADLYQANLVKLDEQYEKRMDELSSKVEALNELLTFTKDNADSKTDNSNKLYSELNEVKKQLNELKKNLDVLK